MFDWIDRLPRARFGLLLALPSAIFLFSVILYPLVNLIITSLQTHDELFNASFVGLGNYQMMFQDTRFWQDLGRSFLYTIGSILIFFPAGFAVALSLNRIGRYETLFRGISLLPWAIPPVTAAMMWRWSLNGQYGIVNDWLLRLHIVSEPINWLTNGILAMFVIIAVDAWIRIPFTALLLLAGLKAIPEDLYESASMDGAGIIASFRHITLPLLRYPISIILALQTMFAFRTYDIQAVLTGGGPGTATELLVKYIHDAAFRSFDFGTASAVSIIMLIFCFLFVLFYFKMLQVKI
jgi:multiple sugar transport system permease protein